jgi:hypothetical protein
MWLTDGNHHLMGFRDGKVFIKDKEGNTVIPDNQTDSLLEITQDDLGNFQEFIETIRTQEEKELVQYRGDLSLFTDFFLRSYINACQLYFREIVFDLPVSDAISAGQSYTIGTQLKAEGDVVKKEEPVLVILDNNGGPIEIKAPFAGKIKKLLISENEITAPGRSLFTLLDEAKYEEIRSAFIDLGQQLIAANNAIAGGKARSESQMKAMGEAIDLNSYRLDAWISSLAASRLDEMRKKPKYEKGIYFGAYGWVEDLEKDEIPVNGTDLTDSYGEDGGIIHTFGAAQTVASTVFKNSFLAHNQESQSNPFTINLSSDRLQKSQFVLEGVRQGQQLEALLGYQLERELHENNLHEEIYSLREAYPLYENSAGNTTGFVNLSVIDGLKAIKDKENLPNDLQQVKKFIDKLEDTMDASLDSLFFEAGYQVTQGNLSQAAAALGATKGENAPPQIESVQTKITGTGINHKLMMVFPLLPEPYPMSNTRAFAEPHLENWLASVIGPMDRLACQVKIHNAADNVLIENISITLADLKIGYLDFLYLSDEPVSDGGSELELRIRNAAREKNQDIPNDITYLITGEGLEGGLSLIQALEMVRYAKRLLGKCRYMKSEDLSLEGESVRYDREALDAIKNDRLQPLVTHLKELPAAALMQKDTLAMLSAMDFESAKSSYLDGTPISAEILKTAIAEKVSAVSRLLGSYSPELPYYKAFEFLQMAAKSLFGDAFILLPPALASDNFMQVVRDNTPDLLTGSPSDNTVDQVWGRERIEDWIQGLAQVYENVELFEDWSMVHIAWKQKMEQPDSYTFKIIQGPTLSDYPWVALSKHEIDLVLDKQYTSHPIYADAHSGQTYPLEDGRYYPENCESSVLYIPGPMTLEQGVYGLVIQEFAEHIPDNKIETGLSFNYNTPDNEPPQAILLAIHPKATGNTEFFWSEEDLRDILYDTMDLYKIRMVDLEAVQEYGYVLPMTYWFNFPQTK